MNLALRIAHLFGHVRCLFVSHEPNRRRVHKMRDGQHFGYCKYCGIRIRRVGYQDWKGYRWKDADVLVTPAPFKAASPPPPPPA